MTIKLETIAEHEGVTVDKYLARVLSEPVERDFWKIIEKLEPDYRKHLAQGAQETLLRASEDGGRMTMNYILDGHTPKPEPDLLKWGEWFHNNPRHVANTRLQLGGEEVRVSTVFLGIDHNFTGKGLPVLFETMVFNGPHDGDCRRYCTWEEAEAGHAEVVREVSLPAPDAVV